MLPIYFLVQVPQPKDLAEQLTTIETFKTNFDSNQDHTIL